MSSCDYWSSPEYWSRLGERCECIVSKYGKDIVIPTDSVDDPLKEFEVVDVSKNVFRFVVFILRLKHQSQSFEWFLTIRERYPDLWRQCLYRMATL